MSGLGLLVIIDAMMMFTGAVGDQRGFKLRPVTIAAAWKQFVAGKPVSRRSTRLGRSRT